MNRDYYDAVTRLETAGVDPNYILGWQGGWLGNPPLEEQRVTDAYSRGYQDGLNKDTAHSAEWIMQEDG